VIAGAVSEQGVPTIELDVSGRRWTAIIDTGFNGALELPVSLQRTLTGRFVGRVTSLLAAGQTIEEDLYLVDFPFDGEVHQAEATFAAVEDVLIGTQLLRRHRLEIDFQKQTVLIERS
jgi:predicted aspartyl protease